MQSQTASAALLSEGIYRNDGNPEFLQRVSPDLPRILDVGCGAGGNACILSKRGQSVWGVTLSPGEAELAKPYCQQVLVANVEFDDLPFEEGFFDGILLCHVLEHMIQPTVTLQRLARYLKPGGCAFVAVPNMAHWRLRWRFLRGDWRRDPDGPMDRTHLQFFSFYTAPKVFEGTCLKLEQHAPGGVSIPLWPLRRLLPSLSRKLDSAIGPAWPNLFTYQVLMVARKTPAGDKTSG